MVAVLMVIYVFSFIDRQILSLLVGPIRRDLGISDTEMSLLMGFSFAVFYTFFGIPMGRLADSTSRRGLIGAGLIVWSLMTAGCGLAQKFWQFLLLRMGVGVGEAALSPAAYSMITDSFPRKRLATAISVYSMGIYIGSGMATLLGGIVVGMASGQELWTLPLIGETRPWQVVFFIVGLPGVLLTLLLLTFKEPDRRDVRRTATGAVQSVPIREVAAYLRANWKTFTCHNLGFALLSFSSYGSGAWIPAFYQRTYDLTARQAGVYYGLIVMLAGTAGIVSGGRMADWLAHKGYRDSKMRAGLIAAVAWTPTGLLFPLVGRADLSLALLVPTVFFASMPFGCAPAAIQEMMPNAMRGQASALYLFVVNLIGLGLGPTAVAMTTDFVFGDDLAVRYSILAVATLAHIGSALLLWAGLAPFKRSLDHAEEWVRQGEKA
ncbi:MAG TPA: MFS transporter [Thermoanaerobaculia bacterium]|nr:MFS transporter [Thermoanaerobaculia bacterium]